MKTHNKLIITISILFVLGILGTAMAAYTVWTPITDVTITSHSDYDPVSVGQEYTLTCTTSTDRDCNVGVGTVSDPIVHTWSGPGTFDPATGTTVTWIPPDSNGNATITVTASDNGSPTYANDTDKTDSVILTVQNTLYYVDVDANGNDDGTSWTDAFNDLQDAFDAVSSGDEIWVAEGTYKPSELADPGDSRTANFELIDGVGVYGGFDATETARNERDWVNNVTILSGDIDNDDVLDDDNSYHVVYSEDCDTDTILDGFTLTAGNANSSVGGSHNRFGGGMCNNDHSSPTVTNCTFSGNSGLIGGGMSNEDFSSPTVTNCTFIGNAATYSGGAMWMNDYSEPSIINCVFFWNLATGGGAISDMGSAIPGYASSISNCTFVGNVAAEHDGALKYISNHTAATLTNSILWGNSATTFGGELGIVATVDLTISYCNIEGGWDGPKVYDLFDDIIDGGGNISSDPCFVNIFDFSDITIASGTTTTINVTDASLYAVDDEIEYNNDGVARKVTAVNTTTDVVTFANDALSANSAVKMAVYNWGSGATDMDEDLHLTSDSDCIDAGDPGGTYTGQKDMDGEDRENGSEVDIGADEYYSS